MNQDMKDLLRSVYDMGAKAVDCIPLLQNAFIYNSSAPLKECKEAIAAIKDSETWLTKNIEALAKDNPDILKYSSVPMHLLRIAEGLERLAGSIEKKIKDGILFSDRAVTEATFLLQRLSEVLKPTTDIILAHNNFLCRYVQESEAGISKNATEYATLHEERMVTGECLAAASSVYINMLDAIKGIAWHAKEIASILAG